LENGRLQSTFGVGSAFASVLRLPVERRAATPRGAKMRRRPGGPLASPKEDIAD